MNEQRFRSEMRRAKTMFEMESSEPFNADYWEFYQKSLRRIFHGEKFGTQEEHEKCMALIDRDDEQSKRRGQGYRDAISFAEITSIMGQPKRFDAMLDKLPVKKEIKEALIARASEIGESIPDTRRQALKEFLEKK